MADRSGLPTTLSPIKSAIGSDQQPKNFGAINLVKPIERMKTVFLPELEIDPKKEDIELLKLGIDENNILVTGT